MEVWTAGAWPVTTTSPKVFGGGLGAVFAGGFGGAGGGAASCATASEGRAAAMAAATSSVRKIMSPNSLASPAALAMIHTYSPINYTRIFGKVGTMSAAKIPGGKISGAESQIMDALWRCGPLTPDGI